MSKSHLPLTSCTVVGAGAWGTALAIHLSRSGIAVRLYDRDSARCTALQSSQENKRYLPGVTFPGSLSVISALQPSVRQTDFTLIAVPSSAFESALQECEGAPAILWATKGFDPKTGQLLYQLVDRYFPNAPRALITGPSFATEVAQNHPTAVVLAAHDLAHAQLFQKSLNTQAFRTYLSDDLIGACLGGATKNVLAIAVGIAAGLGLGANTRAALITRGLAEMQRLGVALGAKPETLAGLSGLGDLILTCSDDQSRNRRFGFALGQGLSIEQAKHNIGQVVEGIEASISMHQLIVSHHLYAPIATQVYEILSGKTTIHQAFTSLLGSYPHSE